MSHPHPHLLLANPSSTFSISMADVWSQPIQIHPTEDCQRALPLHRAPAPAAASLPPVYPEDPYSEVFPLEIPREKRNHMNSPIFLVDGANGSVTYEDGDDSRLKSTLFSFKGDTFTVDGGPPRNINDPDPKIRSFLRSLINEEVPTEFGEGCHVITAMKYDGDDIKEEDLILTNSDESSDDSSYYSNSDEE